MGAGGGSSFCELPGSVRFESGKRTVVPGGQDTAKLDFLTLPDGFCVHTFGNVGNPRQIRFAPNGELFVASPTTGTTGGGPNGKAAILILADKDADGYADGAPVTYLDSLPSTQGLLFAKGHFYYQNGTKILRVPYASGDHAPSGPAEQVVDVTLYTSSLHWPKTLDEGDDGTIYVTNGGDEGETCDPSRPFHGGVLIADGSTGGKPIVKGCRNPIGMKCDRGHGHCFAVELAKDYTMNKGGREKLLPIRDGDDWGFPCCASKDLPYPGVMPTPDCSATVADTVSFYIGDTPFSVDFSPATWPAPWGRNAIVPTHGAAGSWSGARVVAVAMDPATDMPVPASNIDGGVNSSGMKDFATGWDDLTQSHGRPASVTFAKDGRMFLSNDTNGEIIWIAPIGM
jgi:hypothetical protein